MRQLNPLLWIELNKDFQFHCSMPSTSLSSKLLYCKTCKRLSRQSRKTQYSPHASPHFLCITCEDCSDVWFICAIHNRRWTSDKRAAAVQHFADVTINHSTTLHSNIVPTTNDATENHNLNINDHMDFNLSQDLDDINEQETCQVISQNHTIFDHMSPNSQRFFKLLITKPDQNPAQYLVHAAFSGNAVFSSQYCNKFETKFHIRATKLCLSMTHSQHIQLCHMLHMLASCMQNSNINNKFVFTRLPTSHSDVNKFYLKKSTSIRKSLPHPHADEIKQHAVINLRDVLSHIFAYGTKLEGHCPYDNHEYTDLYVGTSQKIFTTPFMKQTINDVLDEFPPTGNLKPLIVFGTIWSDGFDANNVVHNAPSIWIRTITISPPQDDTTSTKHTFVLHMSREGVCHEHVNRLFNQELDVLQHGAWFYSSLLHKPIFVVLKIHVYTADRPERGKLTQILGHTGLSTKRWMYSAFLPDTGLKSCNACFDHRVQKAKSYPDFNCVSRRLCSRCADWNYDHPKMTVLTPTGYPSECAIDSPRPHETRTVGGVAHLKPLILTFDNLKASAQFIFYNIYRRTFNIAHAKAYGKSVGLSLDCVQSIIINQATHLRTTNPNLPCEHVLRSFQYPAIWNAPIALNQFIDAPMHLIFQGIIKSIIEMISNWLTPLSPSQSYYKELCKIINPMMVKISNMNLTWCALNTFNVSKNYKPSGWIASNYLAFARLMLVCYRYVRTVIPSTEPGLMQCEGMIQSGLCLVSYIMSKHNDDPRPIMEYTKLFLSCVDKFESTVYIQETLKPIWKSRGNFLSLLNLPLQQQYFGTVRNFWEGERERYIQQIKPLLTNLRHSASFLVTKLERLYQAEAIDYVQTSLFDDEDVFSLDTVYERNNDFIVYKDLSIVNELITNGEPFSGIHMSINNDDNARAYCVAIQAANKTIKCHAVQFAAQEGYKRCGHYYRHIEVFDNGHNELFIFDNRSDLAHNASHFILFVSNLEQDNRSDYTIISNEWLYLKNDMNLGFNSIQNNLFNKL